METNRRDFLKGTAWMGATAALAGCVSSAVKLVENGGMSGFAAPALGKVRVGVAGLGMRGTGAVHRLANIPESGRVRRRRGVQGDVRIRP